VLKRILAALLCISVPVLAHAASDEPNSYKVMYDGGSLANIKAGTDAKLIIHPTEVLLIKDKVTLVTIPADKITEISYGQDVHRRIGAAIGLAVISLGIGALMAFTKSKKHYIGITWSDGDKKGGFAVQADKSDYRGQLTALEGITGKKAVDSDAMNVKN